MHNGMKYVIVKGYLQEKPFLFPADESHAVMAPLLNRLDEPIIAAGFVDIVDGVVSAHGESDSLGVASRPRDSVLIGRHLGIDM